MSQQASNDDLLAQLGDLAVKSPTGPAAGSSASAATTSPTQDDDPLAKLESLVKQSPIPRSSTPRISVEASRSSNATPKPAAAASAGPTGPSAAATTATAAETGSQLAQPSAGGWAGWGNFVSGFAATATQKATEFAGQANAAISSIQQNPETLKLVGQVHERANALRGLGKDFSAQALPTFNQFLDSLAPPISRYEILHIHVSHPTTGYPPFPNTVRKAFGKVQDQVEGASIQTSSFGESHSNYNFKGWDDRAWWQLNDNPATAIHRHLNTASGINDGIALSIAGARSSAASFFAENNTTLEDEVAKYYSEKAAEEEGDIKSHVFLAIQPVTYDDDIEASLAGAAKDATTGASQVPKDVVVAFAICLYDPVHSILFRTVSQSFPQQWVDWLEYFPGNSDDEASENDEDEDEDDEDDEDEEEDAEEEDDDDNDGSESGAGDKGPRCHPDIEPLIRAGAIDPREWASGWINESLAMAVTTLAQRYVSRRMGIGAPSQDGSSKQQNLKTARPTEEVVYSGAGEAARAMAI